ncbi:protein serine/threonine phosphatase [Streptomyces zinciresistens K42]|uniref:Protein serine/threonine phosphatase n=1 Tax=Streptomyces zinciresistens K42 TaxID=700597 RepID=G2GJ28_9ACTN|nr:PP2C family serine/threonine-protein phosphatase [Streptomyces zinciresistens]EGX56491.1 protein serine/threonine phosphatase [Streptomyces zinciresistens K42]
MPYVAVSAISHPGLLREHNEDSLAIGPWTLCATVTESPQTLVFPLGTPLVVAVADGLGGHPGGEVASALVVRRMATLGPALSSETAVRDAVNACNRAVYQAADGDGGGLTAMGTTVAGLVIQPDAALVFNVGDSEVLAAGADGLRLLSVDDNPPHPPGRPVSLVTQCLGGSPAYRAVDPHVSTAPLTPGARWLVCSDGLTDPVPRDVVEEILRAHDDGRAAFELWHAAIAAGGPDNITVAVVRVGEEQEPPVRSA